MVWRAIMELICKSLNRRLFFDISPRVIGDDNESSMFCQAYARLSRHSLDGATQLRGAILSTPHPFMAQHLSRRTSLWLALGPRANCGRSTYRGRATLLSQWRIHSGLRRSLSLLQRRLCAGFRMLYGLPFSRRILLSELSCAFCSMLS